MSDEKFGSILQEMYDTLTTRAMIAEGQLRVSEKRIAELERLVLELMKHHHDDYSDGMSTKDFEACKKIVRKHAMAEAKP